MNVTQELPQPPGECKAELLCSMASRYPEMNVSTIQLITLIKAISKSLTMLLNQSLTDAGLTEGKFYVLAFLFSEELMGHAEPSPSQIADHLDVTRGTVTGLLDGLEREGYLERFDAVNDRRALRIRISEKSRVFLDKFLPSITTEMDELIGLSNEDRQKLIKPLAKIEQSMRQTGVVDG